MPVPAEADGPYGEGPVLAHYVHLQLVNAFTIREGPGDEGALSDSFRIPGERHHHPRVVVPNLDGLPARVQPQGERPGPQPEGPNDRLLRPPPEVHGREERAQPIGACLRVACHGRLLIEEQRPPLPAHPHGRHDASAVDLIQPPKAISIPVVVELAHGPHPRVPLPDMRLHIIQRPRAKAIASQKSPHALQRPVLVPLPNMHTPPSLTDSVQLTRGESLIVTRPQLEERMR